MSRDHNEIEYGEDLEFTEHANILKKYLSKGVFERISDIFSKFNIFSRDDQSLAEALSGSEDGEIAKTALKAANAMARRDGLREINLDQPRSAIKLQSISEALAKRSERNIK